MSTNETGNSTSLGVSGELLRDVVELVGSIQADGADPADLNAYEMIAMEDHAYHFVKSGDYDSLLRMPLPAKSAPIAGVSPVLHLKCLLVAFNAICLHAALDGGISAKIGYGLNSQLAMHIMTCTTEEELTEIMDSRIIPVSYGLLVHELSLPGVTDKDIVRAIRYIHDHHHERITVRMLAEHVGLSPEYLSSKFKRETGLTVSAYISRARIGEAKAMLRFSDLSIGEIAAQLSFSSQSYFQTAFKRETGMTPQQYRTTVADEGGETP